MKPEPSQGRSWSTLAKSLLITGVLAGSIALGSYEYNSSGLGFSGPQSDNITENERHERLDNFNALTSLQLNVVSRQDENAALDTMNLDTDSKHLMLADIARQHLMLARNAATLPAAERMRELAKPSSRLAWITLWDTDAQDGDTVRLDSQGYSRTIILKKAPMTFAVPIPANGILTVTGIRDGDGGGITVGLASGASKAVFPIMSEGQALSLKVVVP
jgi:hypothetical protein